MSQKTDNPVIEIAPQAETEPTETVENPNFVQKTKQFVKNHKKSTIAVGALVGLVGLAAVTGRKSESSDEPQPLELTPAYDYDVEVIESTETETA